MANFFDQYDAPSAPVASSGNFFDQFDAASVPVETPSTPSDPSGPALADIVSKAIPQMEGAVIPEAPMPFAPTFDQSQTQVDATPVANQDPMLAELQRQLQAAPPALQFQIQSRIDEISQQLVAENNPTPVEPTWTDDKPLSDILKQRGRQIAAGAIDVPASIPEALAIAGAGNDNAAAQLGSEIVAEAESMFDAAAERLIANPDMNDEDRARLEAVIVDSQEKMKAYTPLVEIAEGPLKPAADQRALFWRGKQLRDAVTDKVGAPDPTDETFTGKLAQGAGSLIGFVGTTILGGVPVAAGTGAAANASSTYKEARVAGLTDDEAKTAAGLAGILGSTEVIPIGRALDLLPTSLKSKAQDAIARRLTDAITTGGEESAQEALVTIGNNVIAGNLYDPDRGWSDDVGESALIGAILGGGLGAVTSTKAAGPAITPATPEVPDEPETPVLPQPDEVQDDGNRGSLPGVDGRPTEPNANIGTRTPIDERDGDEPRSDISISNTGGRGAREQDQSTRSGNIENSSSVIPVNQRKDDLNGTEPLQAQPADQNTALPKAPETPQKKPLTNRVQTEIGRIDPTGPVGQELISQGVTPSTAPQLFSRDGLNDLDNIPASEQTDIANLVGLEDDGIYLNRNGLIDAIVDEFRGLPAKLGRQQEVQAEYEAYEADLAEIEQGYSGEISLPLPADVPSWRVPARDQDISTGVERFDMIQSMVRGFEGSIGEGISFSPQERQMMVSYLDENGGPVEAAVERVILGDISYAKTGTEPTGSTARQVSRADQRDIERPEDTPGAEGQGPESPETGERARTGTTENGRVDLTPEGEQTVIPGAQKITDKQQAERKQQTAKRGGDAPTPKGGLFDDDARNQGRLLDTSGKAGRRPKGTLSPSFIDFSYTTRRSVYGHAFREAGIDPEKGSLLPVSEQLSIVSKAVTTRFGIQVELPTAKVRKKNLVGRAVTKEVTSLSERKALDQLLNAYRQLQMLAHVMSIPEKAIGLPIEGKGLTLSLVSGNRLRGALGMFSWGGGKRTISLPDMSNSFAHEWGHALDHYLGAMSDKPFLKGMLSRAQANKGLQPGLSPKRALTDAFAHVIWSMYGNSSQAGAIVLQAQVDSAQIGPDGKPTPKAKKAQKVLNDIRAGKTPPSEYLSNYFKTSKRYDEQVEADGYFTDPAEMFARAFEAMVGVEVAKVSDQPQAFLSKGEWAYKDSQDDRAALTFPKDVDLQQFTLAMVNLQQAMSRINLFGANAPASAPENHDVLSTKDLLKVDSSTKIGDLTTAEIKEWGRTFEIMKAFPSAAIDKFGRFKNGMSAFYAQAIQTGSATLFAVSDKQNNPKARVAFENIAKTVGKRPGRGKLVTNIWEESVQRKSRVYFNKIEGAVSKALKASGQRKISREDLETLRKLLTEQGGMSGKGWLETLAADMRAILNDLYYDLQSSGVKVGFESGYLPHIYDRDRATKNPDGFTAAGKQVYALMFDKEIAQSTDQDGQLSDMKAILRGLQGATKATPRGDRAPDPRLSQDQQSTVIAYFDAVKKLKKHKKALKKLVSKSAIAKRKAAIAAIEVELDALRDAALAVLKEAWSQHSAENWMTRTRAGDLTDVGSIGPTSNFLKERKFPNEAGQIMRDFMNDDPVDLITGYAGMAMRKAEYAKLFGAENEKLQNMLDAAEGATEQDMEMVKGGVKAATGRFEAGGPGITSFFSTASMLGNIALLPYSVFASLAEPAVTGMRTGNATDSLKGLGLALVTMMRRKKYAELRELSRTIGLTAPMSQDNLMEQRFGMDAIGGPSWLQPVVSRFFIINGLTPLTHYQRTALIPLANQVILRHLRADVKGKRSIGMKARDFVDGEKGGFSDGELNEIGIAKGQRKDLLEWIEGTGGLPKPSDLIGPDGEMHKAAELWARAVYRLDTEIIQDPLKTDAPQAANNPSFAAIYSIMGFMNAFTRNAIFRTFERGMKDGDSKSKKLAKATANLGMAAAPIVTLIAAQTVGNMIREAVQGIDKFDDMDDEEAIKYLITKGFNRSGLQGRFDPILQMYTGVKYETDMTSMFAGAKMAYFLRNVQQVLKSTNGRNSENTNTTEHAAVKAMYELFVKVPALTLIAGVAPGGPISVNGARAAMMYLSTPSTKDDFADGLVGEKGSKHVGSPPWWEMSD